MKNKSSLSITAAAFGVFGGFFGAEHGIGEILQGNTAVESARIFAYQAPGLPFPFAREPAMTLLPNYLSAGIISLIMGLAVILWSVLFLKRKFGSVVLLFLAVVLFLAGGGYAPASVLVAACIAAAKSRSEFRWLKKYLPIQARTMAGGIWPWFLILSLIWVPMEFLLGIIFRIGYPYPGYLLAYAVPIWMTLTLITGIASDSVIANRME